MARRISTTVDKINGDVAIQPSQDDLKAELLRSALDYVERKGSGRVSLLLEDHQGVTLVDISSVGAERTSAGSDIGAFPGFEHRVARLSDTGAGAVIRKDAECTEGATQPESVQRFEQLIKNFRKKVLQLLDLFSQEAAKESGKVFVNVIASFLKAVGSVLMFLMLAYLFSHL
jgi:hypothetical protein